jgi:hypothetical protein
MNLSVSTLFFELALIFMPGFIWMKIQKSYGAKGEVTQFDLILNAFIFGVVSYAILGLIYWVIGAKLHILELKSSNDEFLPTDVFPEIFYALLISVSGGIIFLYFENYKLLTKFVQFIGATRTYGDEDVWDFVFTSRTQSVNFVHFRDFEQRVVYAGYVDLFSESGDLRELVLRGVYVYDFEGKEMYQVPRLYLARGRDKIHIEFPEEI